MSGVLPDWPRVVRVFAAPSWWNEPWPFGVFLLGLFMVILAVNGTITGKAYYRGSTDRAKEPLTYWMVLVTQYLGGAFLVWHWLTHYR
jgi:hypothetical protein